MPECVNSPYALPTIEFVGGETQDLIFNVFFYVGRKPYGLEGCDAMFSVVSALNKRGTPVIQKEMKVMPSTTEGTPAHSLAVTLTPKETVELCGKYIYQIQIHDTDGDNEIPKQGLMYITNNIDKAFVNNFSAG